MGNAASSAGSQVSSGLVGFGGSSSSLTGLGSAAAAVSAVSAVSAASGVGKKAKLNIKVVYIATTKLESWYSNQIASANPTWTRTSDTLSHVAYSNGQVYGLQTNGQLWYKANYDRTSSGGWNMIRSIAEATNTRHWLKQLSFDGVNMIIMGITENNQIIYANQDITAEETKWRTIPYPNNARDALYIAYSNGKCMAIILPEGNNPIFNIVYKANYTSTANDWIQISKDSLPGVSFANVCFDGVNNIIVALTTTNIIYYSNQNIYTTNPTWYTNSVPTSLNSDIISSISFSNYQIYCVNLKRQIFYNSSYTNPNTWMVINAEPKATQISFEDNTGTPAPPNYVAPRVFSWSEPASPVYPVRVAQTSINIPAPVYIPPAPAIVAPATPAPSFQRSQPKKPSVTTYITATSALFQNENTDEFWLVPNGVTQAIITVIGGSGGTITGGRGIGGKGGLVKATINVTPGDILDIRVGQNALGSVAGHNYVGYHGSDGTGTGTNAGTGGGAASTVHNNGTVVIVAGGGGGCTNTESIITKNENVGGSAGINKNGDGGDGS